MLERDFRFFHETRCEVRDSGSRPNRGPHAKCKTLRGLSWRTNSRSKAVAISGSQGDRCATVLESSSSPGTRQRLARHLVCALILSLWQRERRAFGSALAIIDSRQNRQFAQKRL